MTNIRLNGQTPLTPAQIGALPIPNEVNHVVGVTVTKIVRPVYKKKAALLILLADKGGWRIASRDRTATGTNDMLTEEFPPATRSDGLGAAYLREGSSVGLPSPDVVTVLGFAADSVLTYWWL